MIDPWAWTLSTTLVVIGWVVTAAITIIGWRITAARDRKAAEMAERRAEEAASTERRRFEERLKAANGTVESLRMQVKAMQDTADALRGQLETQRVRTDLATDAADVPEWRIYQVQNLKYAVENGNTFDAHDVHVVLASGKEYVLGDITKGSSIGFIFMEKGIWCGDGDADISITWTQSGDPARRSVTKPSPRYVKS